MSNSSLRLCAYCEQPLEGRADKKFCNTNCRVQFGSKVAPEIADPEKTLELTRKQVEAFNKQLIARGLRPVQLASDIPPIKFISSGVPEIDAMTQGFPRKRITEIFGPKGVGKTTLMSKIVSGVQDLHVLYIDAEGGLPERIVQSLPNIVLSHESVLEDIEESVHEALDNGEYDLIVIDSVASASPRTEVENNPGSAMPVKAKLMSQWMRRITGHLMSSNTAVVFINQQRDNINAYGPRTYTPGGVALGYAASLRLELKSNKADKFEGGQWVHVEIEKSRICKPYQKTKFKLIY